MFACKTLGYSWTVITAIGKYCPNVSSFHLNIWSEDIEDADMIDIEEGHFPSLQDLKIKCEEQVEQIPEVVFFYFFCSAGDLKIVQYIAPLAWLNHFHFTMLVNQGVLSQLEMTIIANTSMEQMNLGLDTVQLLLDSCANLTILGSSKSWKKIDYFDPGWKRI